MHSSGSYKEGNNSVDGGAGGGGGGGDGDGSGKGKLLPKRRRTSRNYVIPFKLTASLCLSVNCKFVRLHSSVPLAGSFAVSGSQ